MYLNHPLAFVMLFFVPASADTENPWKEKVPAAVAKAERLETVTALETALDVTWKADAWQDGLKLARRALAKPAVLDELRGRVVRALWRAGRLLEAEELALGIPSDTTDRVSLRVLIEMHMASGRIAEATALARRLETRRPLTAEDLYVIFAVRFARGELDGMADRLRQAEKLTDPAHGYPETYVAEAIEGLAAFLDAVGSAPLNQVAAFGSAPMPPLVMLRLPSCDAYINGRGPYRMIVDTGGSIMIALDQQVADEIGLKSVAESSVRGVAGKSDAGQVLIEELQIGSIKCRRVMSRTFDVRNAIMNAADGIIGTGIFHQGRLTLDFENGQLHVLDPDAPPPTGGHEVPLRIVADAKLLSPIQINDEPSVALLDTGADAVALSPVLMQRLFPDQPVMKVQSGLALGVGSEKAPEISVGQGVNLQFGRRTFENYGGLALDVLDDVLSPVLGVHCNMLLGMPTFREMSSCTIDFPSCRMWVRWLKEE